MTQRLGKKRFTDNIEVSGNVVSDGLFVSSVEIDTSGAANDQALVFDGTKFSPADVAGGVEVSDAAPSAPEEGDIWFDSTTGSTFVYYDSFWVETGPSGAVGPVQTNIPQSTNTTLISSDAGKHVNISANATINSSTAFSVGDVVTIYNSSAGNITITATGITLRLAGTASTGNRTLAQKGLATVLCIASNDYVIAGAGIS